MTSLDPSHVPWLAGNSDPTRGQAVHTLVSAVTPEIAALKKAEARHEAFSEFDDEDDDEDDEKWFKRRQRAREGKKRQQDHEAASRGLISTMPIPDVRFEQSYLMSIRPFIRTTSTRPQSRSSAHMNSDTTPRRESVTRDKRRRLEESLALVEDPASRTGGALNDIFSSDPSRAEKHTCIDWESIVYITFRDQLLSPLIQGAAWALGGLVWTGAWSYWSSQRKTASAFQNGPSLWEKWFGPLAARVTGR